MAIFQVTLYEDKIGLFESLQSKVKKWYDLRRKSNIQITNIIYDIVPRTDVQYHKRKATIHFTGDICPMCHRIFDRCLCCDRCLVYPCQCEYCKTCREWIEDCKCCKTCKYLPCKCCDKCKIYPCQCCEECKQYPCECPEIITYTNIDFHPPVFGEVATTSIKHEQWTARIVWYPELGHGNTFSPDTSYMADIHVIANEGYTTKGMENDWVVNSVPKTDSLLCIFDITESLVIKTLDHLSKGECIELLPNRYHYPIKFDKGMYKIECQGVSGYTRGNITIEEDITLYGFVGFDEWNSGSSDIRLISSDPIIWNEVKSLRSRIMVAAGTESGAWRLGVKGDNFISGHPESNALKNENSPIYSGQPNHYSGLVFTNTQIREKPGSNKIKITRL